MSTATELLRRALESLEEWKEERNATCDDVLIEDIRAFLAAEPETEEPVAWIQPNHLDKAQFMPFLCRVEPKQRDDFIPLYTRPEPARKPMTEEEIDAGFRYGDVGYMNGFFEGIRLAEKHHGIGGDDNG